MSHHGGKWFPPHPQFVKQIQQMMGPNVSVTADNLARVIRGLPMMSTIKETLAKIEQRDNVKILYAVESGSRAWGFESEDSDWDVRFIYIKPFKHYMSINNWQLDNEQSDTLKWKDDSILLDCDGWDLKKALQLLAKSNPPFLEWLRSPIVYLETKEMEGIRAAAETYYSPKAAVYHYHHMAEGNWRQYIRGTEARESGKVPRKKYLYVLRPILACRWIEMYDSMPPMEIDKLIEGTLKNNSVGDAIRKLIDDKRNSREMDEGPKNWAIEEFLEPQIEYFGKLGAKIRSREKDDMSELNELFMHLAVP